MASLDLSAIVAFPATFTTTLAGANVARLVKLPSVPQRLRITFVPATTAATLAADQTITEGGAVVGAAVPLAADTRSQIDINSPRVAQLALLSTTGGQVVVGIIECAS